MSSSLKSEEPRYLFNFENRTYRCEMWEDGRWCQLSAKREPSGVWVHIYDNQQIREPRFQEDAERAYKDYLAKVILDG